MAEAVQHTMKDRARALEASVVARGELTPEVADKLRAFADSLKQEQQMTQLSIAIDNALESGNVDDIKKALTEAQSFAE